MFSTHERVSAHGRDRGGGGQTSGLCVGPHGPTASTGLLPTWPVLSLPMSTAKPAAGQTQCASPRSAMRLEGLPADWVPHHLSLALHGPLGSSYDDHLTLGPGMCQSALTTESLAYSTESTGPGELELTPQYSLQLGTGSHGHRSSLAIPASAQIGSDSLLLSCTQPSPPLSLRILVHGTGPKLSLCSSRRCGSFCPLVTGSLL